MNSEERRLLTTFLDQLEQVRGAAKDADAEALIREAAARQPDALYLLVQKALLQERALDAAKTQLAELRSRVDPTRANPQATRGGFLSQDPWAAATARPAPAASSPWPAAAAAPAASGFGGLGSFLGTAAATAAGIAGGAFLFRGLENLLGQNEASRGLPDPAGAEPGHADRLSADELHGTDADASDPGLDDTGLGLGDLGLEGFDDYGDDDGGLSV